MSDSQRLVRLNHFNTWAGEWGLADAWLAAGPGDTVATRVANPSEPALLAMARLDCDWHAENTRCYAAMEGLSTRPACVFGPAGLAGLAAAARQRSHDEDWWLIFDAQGVQSIAAVLPNLLGFLRKTGVRVLYYAFDEASRTMPCFNTLAPYLDVLIHDEAPLAESARGRLRPECLTIHRSWVANLLPFQAPFNEAPEEKILFLGSQLGLTDHRKRQIAFLQKRFKDRFVASHDHSVSVADRLSLNRFKVGFCPEGRKFITPTMSRTHTDRPFWSGCLGMAPVSENSRQGGRLDDLADDGLILRYDHGDLKALETACEKSLAVTTEQRRRIYEHFNRHETVGTVVSNALAEYYARNVSPVSRLTEAARI